MSTFALLVGTGAGLGTIVFVRMIAFFNELFFGGGSQLPLPSGTYVILLPALGSLLVGPLVHFIAPEAKGHGVPEVLTAIATRGGRIRPVVVLVKALGSAITIGSGGSVGREGPIVQIGAALGSTLGQVFKLNERRVVNLVAAGAAGGIAATFNAPIAGVMFAIEVILGDLRLRDLSTLIISAVTASVVSQAVLGSSPAFSMPAYDFNGLAELPLYLGLGIASGLAAMLFVRALYFMEELFDGWKFPPYLKPVVGGLGVGLLGYFLPQVFGTGFEVIGQALSGQLGLALLLVLIFGKILATTLTLGAGSSGGVFAPALFIGAVLGGAYGQVAQAIFPGLPAPSGAYAMIGMAAVFAGAARAPITAILILFEMTQDYHIVLPLMFATIVSTLIAQRLEPESIYTLKLKLRGIDLQAKRAENPIQEIRVAQAMTRLDESMVVPASTSLQDLVHIFQETGHHGLVVLDAENLLYGVVTLSDLELALGRQQPALAVAEFCTRKVVTIHPEQTLDEALRQFGALDVGRIPVVERSSPRQIVGVLRRSDIIHALSSSVLGKQERAQHLDRLQMESQVGSRLTEIYIKNDDDANGKLLKEIALPEECVVVSIQRGRNVVVPRGFTRLLAGDRLIVLVNQEAEEALRQALREGQPKEGVWTPKS
jgi:chloride channel protein, CIC family